ncbi:MAG: DUF4430 domain-containing protein [Ruminococcus sp.]|nr:DUF4430 domain-containing protein [Ruminococcus sp.]
MKSFRRKPVGVVCAFLVLCLCSCANNTARTINDNITIQPNGIIEESVLNQLKNNNSIGIFTGESNGIKYEWTVFGSDITTPHQLNMAIDIDDISDDNSIAFSMKSDENFGFSSMLSIYLDRRWNTQSATAFADNNGQLIPVGSVSITGTDSSILNFSITETHGRYVIKADKNESDTETEEVETDDDKIMTCTFSIECTTVFNNINKLESEKLDILPSDGIILETQTVEFKEGESVFDVLQRVCKENNIPFESSWTPVYNSTYIEGINNLYAFDCGNLSGWTYRVNGWCPDYSCSRYQLTDGEKVELLFTCDSGKDIGGGTLSQK